MTGFTRRRNRTSTSVFTSCDDSRDLWTRERDTRYRWENQHQVLIARTRQISHRFSSATKQLLALHRFTVLQHRLRIPHTHCYALVHTLNGQSSDESGTNTRSILGRQDLYRIIATTESLAISASRPVQDFFEGLCTSCLVYKSVR